MNLIIPKTRTTKLIVINIQPITIIGIDSSNNLIRPIPPAPNARAVLT